MKKRTGFTIIELLTVIAIIAILTAILIPTVSRVRKGARDTQSRAQFSQWITAIEMFRTEYGHWPDFRSKEPDWKALPLEADGNLVIRVNEPKVRQNFFEFLSGRHANGDPLEPPFLYEKHPNRRRISFYEFSEADYEFTDSSASQINKTAGNVELVDSWGNPDIVIVMDGDRDGIIPLSDNATYKVKNENNPETVPAVAPYASNAAAPYNLDGAQRDVRASVIIFSPGKEANNLSDAYQNMIRSW